MKKVSLFLMINICFLISVKSQDTLDHAIKLSGVHFGNGRVVLRWVPTTPSAWELGNYYGYKLERAELSKNADDTLKWQTIAPALKPLNLEQWKNLVAANRDDIYLQAAGQTILGEKQKFNLQNINDVFKSADQFNNLYSACMLSCEFSALAAKSAALRYEDQVDIGKIFIYRISSICPDTSISITPSAVTINTESTEEWPKVFFEKTYEGEKNVQLYWNREFFQPYYSAYNVYRGEDGKNFKKLNEIPFAYRAYKDDKLMMFRDSLPTNYKAYFYKIEGLTSYGTSGPMSEVIILQGKDRTPPTAPYNITTKYLGNNRMQINWEVDPTQSDIAGFRISKSDEKEKEYIEITKSVLPPVTRTYIDSTCNDLINNYYFIGIFDNEGNVNVSMPQYGTIIDSIPPNAPKGLTGIIDTNGIVTVKWNLGMEPDLKGYLVHYSNDKRHTFINITDHPLQDTVWRDTIPLNVLTENIYYKVVAIDQRSNYSKYSEVLKLKKPDLVPPASPVFIGSRVTETGIELEWYNSSSIDVFKNYLVRQKNGTNIYEIIHAEGILNKQGYYKDLSVIPGEKYNYQVYAVDDAGLESERVGTITVTAYVKKILPPIEMITLTHDEKTNRVKLLWDYKDFKNYRFIIYQSVNDHPYLTYKSVNGENIFIDKSYKKGDIIRFKVKAINEKEWQSDFSKEVIFNF